jgi:hypothetical protein
MARQVQTRQQKGPGLVYRQDHDQSRHWCWGVEMGLKKMGHSFSRGLHTTIFQPEILLEMIPPHSRSLDMMLFYQLWYLSTHVGIFTELFKLLNLDNFKNSFTFSH